MRMVHADTDAPSNTPTGIVQFEKPEKALSTISSMYSIAGSVLRGISKAIRVPLFGLSKDKKKPLRLKDLCRDQDPSTLYDSWVVIDQG